MEQVYFSAALPGFILAAWKDDGTYSSETWPADAVLLTEDEVISFWKQTAPDGKKIGSLAGRPVWVDLPPPTREQLIASAEQVKGERRAIADSAILPLQDAVDLDMATDEEKTLLLAWKKYRVGLNRIDTVLAPDINWPEAPAT